MFLLLTSWVKLQGGTVYCEANCPNLLTNETAFNKIEESTKRYYIVLKLPKYRELDEVILAVEFMASDEINKVEEHLAQASHYSAAIKATQTAVIHFFVSNNADAVKVENHSTVPLIQVWHNLEWRHMNIYENNVLKKEVKCL